MKWNYDTNVHVFDHTFLIALINRIIALLILQVNELAFKIMILLQFSFNYKKISFSALEFYK